LNKRKNNENANHTADRLTAAGAAGDGERCSAEQARDIANSVTPASASQAFDDLENQRWPQLRAR
jgi:hypothetical protein